MPSGDPGEPEEGPVLGPEELDISQEDNVLEIDDGRYVISPDEDSSPNRPENEPDFEASPSEREVKEKHSQELKHTLEREDIHDWLNRDFADIETQYGFDVTGKFDNAVTQQRLVSNNIVTVFENLILWYAQQVGGETPVEEVLGILLSEANVPIRYPHRTLVALLRYHELDSSNTVGELLEAVDENEGVLLPPARD